MASLQILKSSLSPISASKSSNFSTKKRGFFCSEFNWRKCLKFQSNRVISKRFNNGRYRFCCKLQDGDNQNNGKEPPESLFMKELKKRGMTPTSLLEEESIMGYGNDEISYKEEDGGFSKRHAVSKDPEKNLSNQRESSMLLRSEGLEGLFPHGKLFLSLGSTFFLAFWQLILITVASFIAMYLYFGPAFIHDGQDNISPLLYINPYSLLEDQRISQTALRLG